MKANGLLAAAAVTAVIAAAGGAAAQTPGRQADVSGGRRVALNVCATCHVVAKDQPFAPALRQPAPSFAAIANRPSTSAGSLRTFLSTTHASIQNPSGMPNPQLTDDQLTDVVAYLVSLRTRR